MNMIPHYGDYKLRKGDFGLTQSPYGYVYFHIKQVKSNGKIFARLTPSNTNKLLKRSICRVLDLNYGYWKLI